MADVEHEVVTEEEWLARRKELLAKEKELSRLTDEVNAARAKLPWKKLEKEYEFVGKDGKVPFSALFGKHQNLLVFHAMMEDDWEKPCKNCSFWMDGFSGQLPHLEEHAAFAVIVHASYDKFAKVAEMKGWSFPFYSSSCSSFNVDMGVGFTAAQMAEKTASYNFGTTKHHPSSQAPGASAFRLAGDGSTVYHAYSTFARGLSNLNGCYSWIDFIPGTGRLFEKDLSYTMAWIQHKENYN
mmetsp:Transcript_30013/g.83869  ORF Transcript_30013/g.83869 Transcript_30013/m.83869 type:complete len:240 (+) Transcript_30013:65-784(+)